MNEMLVCSNYVLPSLSPIRTIELSELYGLQQMGDAQGVRDGLIRMRGGIKVGYGAATLRMRS